MSPALLNAYAEMMPRLEAEEAMLQRMVIASGTGNLKDGVDRRFMGQLQRSARATTGIRVRTVEDLQKTGLPVKKVRRG